jgi:hypothetical protein
VWGLLFVGVVAGLNSQALVRIQDRLANRFEGRALRTVDSVLEVVGPEVVIDSVEFEKRRTGIAATYYWKTRTITISPLVKRYDEDDLLALVCHEVVHAMFDQKDWPSYYGLPGWETYLLAEETAADVLGAHIAGHVRARGGGDGRGLTDRLVSFSRLLADTESPLGLYQTIARTRADLGDNAIDPDLEYEAFVHISSTEMVNDMDRICRENPEPWQAARIIAEKYLQPDREEEKKRRVVSEWLPRR